MCSLSSFLLWLGVSPDLLVLLFLLTRLCRGASSGPNRECTSLFHSPNRVKTFLSPRPSLVNIVAFTGLLRRVGLSLSCLSLENTLAVCEGRVPLDAVTGLDLLFLGLFFLSRDSDSENCVREFRCELSPRASLSDAWVTGCCSPYYSVDNKVVAVRSTSVMLPPFCRVVAKRYAVVDCEAHAPCRCVWIVSLAELREPCTLLSCGIRTPCGRAPVMLLVERNLVQGQTEKSVDKIHAMVPMLHQYLVDYPIVREPWGTNFTAKKNENQANAPVKAQKRGLEEPRSVVKGGPRMDELLSHLGSQREICSGSVPGGGSGSGGVRMLTRAG
ncbi:hypothetical protein Tco_0461870 [Tanacetum coccineum]